MKKKMLKCFNPCFDGMRELNKAKALSTVTKYCFNPCFDGMRELNNLSKNII